MAALVGEEVRSQSWALASPSTFTEPVAKNHSSWLWPLITSGRMKTLHLCVGKKARAKTKNGGSLYPSQVPGALGPSSAQAGMMGALTQVREALG